MGYPEKAVISFFAVAARPVDMDFFPERTQFVRRGGAALAEKWLIISAETASPSFAAQHGFARLAAA